MNIRENYTKEINSLWKKMYFLYNRKCYIIITCFKTLIVQ